MYEKTVNGTYRLISGITASSYTFGANGMAVDGSGNLHLADTNGSGYVLEFFANTGFTTS